MKRFHVHIAVNDLQESIRFYSNTFGVAPSVERTDYAKWMIDEPRINFAISARGHAPGVNHLGFQVDSNEELIEMRRQLHAADASLLEQVGTACCYAKSDKYWIKDPAGIAWETFHSLGTVPVFGGNNEVTEASACCIPLKQDNSSSESADCCVPTSSNASASKCCA